MKIVLIHGQNHKGSTWHISELLVQNISGEKQVTEYFLPRDLNHFCLGCYQCLESREKCPFWEEKNPIAQSIQEADLLIFTTPTYCMMPSAPLKSFLDLFFTNWLMHRPYAEMFSKRAMVISTAAGAGAGKTAKLVAENLKNWGIPQITTYGIAVNAMNWETMPEKKKQKIYRDMKKAGRRLSAVGQPRVGLIDRIRFEIFCGMQKADFGVPQEKAYWEEKGWLAGKKPWKPD